MALRLFYAFLHQTNTFQGCALAAPLPGDKKILVFYRNRMLGTLDFTGSEHWVPFNTAWSTTLRSNRRRLRVRILLSTKYQVICDVIVGAWGKKF